MDKDLIDRIVNTSLDGIEQLDELQKKRVAEFVDEPALFRPWPQPVDGDRSTVMQLFYFLGFACANFVASLQICATNQIPLPLFLLLPLPWPTRWDILTTAELSLWIALYGLQPEIKRLASSFSRISVVSYVRTRRLSHLVGWEL